MLNYKLKIRNQHINVIEKQGFLIIIHASSCTIIAGNHFCLKYVVSS